MRAHRRFRFASSLVLVLSLVHGSRALAQFLVPSPQLWTQAHFPGQTPETGDWFGDVLATGDFNGDGTEDLAVGVPTEGLSGVPSRGVVHIAYGSANGLSTTGAHTLGHQSSGTLPSFEEAAFGRALASGDFNGDGYDDLAVGAPFDDFSVDFGTGFESLLDAGSVEVLFGSASGLAGSARQYLRQGVGTIENSLLGSPSSHEHFGAALASGDFNHDGWDDLAIGVPFERAANGEVSGGAVHTLPGSAAGLSLIGDGLIYQSALPGTGIDFAAQFGATLATGDFNGDGHHDLAIGSPRYTLEWGLNLYPLAGRLHVLFGGSHGITSSGFQTFSQVSSTALGGPGGYDQFGEVLAAGDINGDGRDDLAIGVYRGDFGVGDAGVLNLLFGSGGGLTVTGAGLISQSTSGVPSNPAENEAFGFGLAVGDLSGDGRAETVVGVPGEYSFAGATHRFPGGAAGLLISGSTLTPRSSRTSPMPSGRFGHAIALGDFDGNGLRDIAAGAPTAAVGTVSTAGSVRVTYSAPPDVIGLSP